MPTIDRNGDAYRVRWTAGGARFQVHLGRVSRRDAESFAVRLDELIASAALGVPPSPALRAWLHRLNDRVYARLVEFALVPARGASGLGSWLDTFLEERRRTIKPESVRKLEQTADLLRAHFDERRAVGSITRDEASQWQAAITEGRSAATVRTHLGNARTIFGDAHRRGLAEGNHFDHLRGGSTPSRRNRYVSSDEALAVLAELREDWRPAFALARFAGLRAPSELLPLTWDDVNWSRDELRVRSPKTEAHQHGGERLVPIDARLAPALRDAFERAEPGAAAVIPKEWGGHAWVHTRRAIVAAGIEPWPRLWQSLRSSCAIDWTTRVPAFAAQRWLGHSREVAEAHYLTSVPESVRAMVTGGEGQSEGHTSTATDRHDPTRAAAR